MGYVRVALADPLKREAIDAGFCTVEDAWGSFKAPHVRKLLQWWGTEFRRGHVHPDYWLWRWNDYAFRLVQSHGNRLTGFSIPDIRFVNEAEFVIRQSGYLLCIPPNERSEEYRRKNPQAAQHPSEAGFMEIRAKFGDHTRCIEVANDADIETFHRRIREALDQRELVGWPIPEELKETPLPVFTK